MQPPGFKPGVRLSYLMARSSMAHLPIPTTLVTHPVSPELRSGSGLLLPGDFRTECLGWLQPKWVDERPIIRYTHFSYSQIGALIMPVRSLSSQLSPAMFEILLSLAGADLHGYAIMKEVKDRTRGEVSLGPTTLYRSLNKLLELRFIQEVEEEEDTLGDSRRRYYRLLDKGREAARQRADALSRSVEIAEHRGILSREGAS